MRHTQIFLKHVYHVLNIQKVIPLSCLYHRIIVRKCVYIYKCHYHIMFIFVIINGIGSVVWWPSIYRFVCSVIFEGINFCWFHGFRKTSARVHLYQTQRHRWLWVVWNLYREIYILKIHQFIGKFLKSRLNREIY